MKHRWGDKTEFPHAHKSERTCLNGGCGITKVHRYEREGGQDKHWYEFWLGEERIDSERNTPPCTGKAKGVSYNMTGYPL